MSTTRILIVRTDRVGDVLLSTPVLAVLRRRFPRAHMVVLVSPYAPEVVTPVVALFSPIRSCSPQRWGPWGVGARRDYAIGSTL